MKTITAIEGTDSIITDNYANKNLEFYYYIPLAVSIDKNPEYPVIVCVPGLGGRGEGFVSPLIKRFAEKQKFIIIAPSFNFDERNFNTGKSYQFPSAWSGDALVAILDKIKTTQGLKHGKLYMHGFSAGAQFSQRFGLWKPEIVAAVAGHSSGGLIVPKTFVPVKYLITMGSQDTTRIDYAEKFCAAARREGIDCRLKYFNCGHSCDEPQIKETISFFASVYLDSCKSTK